MDITWEIDDGYCGKSRPQTTTIDDEEFADCETVEDVDDVIALAVQEDFDQLGLCITDETDKTDLLESMGL